MEIIINNVGSIQKGSIKLKENNLNIKYGMNGVGKSTIGNAMNFFYNDKTKISQLTTYGTDMIPEIIVPDKIKSVLYFDKNYVEKFLFKEDLLNNSFEIIVKTKKYDETIETIEKKLNQIRDISLKSEQQSFINTINSFDKAFPISDKTNKPATGAKAKLISGLSKGGDLIKYLDDELEKYEPYLILDNSYLWSDWFKTGYEFHSKSESKLCPFCVCELSSTFDSVVKKMLEMFESKNLKANMESKTNLTNLSEYLSKKETDELKKIMSSKDKISTQQIDNIKDMFLTLKGEQSKIINLQNISAYELSNQLISNKLEIFLENNKLNIHVFENFPDDIINIALEINKLISNLLSELGVLKTDLGKLNSELATSIKDAKKYVNDFLSIAGIPYEITINSYGKTNYRTILKPIGINYEIPNPSQRLSFGEQNAISLVLFSIESYARKTDLIILDDPISSFDETKKYALLYYMFNSGNEKNFYNKTTLMLTHDFSTIIDFLINGKPNSGSTTAAYIYNDGDKLTEKIITRENVKNSIALEKTTFEKVTANIITRLVHLRRWCEINNIKGLEYEMISSLLHLKNDPEIKGDKNEYIKFSDCQILKTELKLKKYIENFNYKEILHQINNNLFLKKSYLSEDEFTKLHIARIFIAKNKVNHNNEVLWKYLCEAYHIENNFLFYLNFNEFNLVPRYIIEECDKIIAMNFKVE